MQTRPILIIWSDWDNTMIASGALFNEVLQRTAAQMQTKGIKLLTPIAAVPTKPQETILIELFGEENFAEVKPVFQTNYAELFTLESLKKMQLFPGVKELLSKVPDAKVLFAIISNHYVEGRADKQDGIKDHMLRHGLEPKNVLIIGLDTLENNGYSAKTHAKPNTRPGELALELWGINPKKHVIKSIMLGDGKSDMEFARNMHRFLHEANKESSCTGILFNTTLTGEPIFSPSEIMTIMQPTFAKTTERNSENVVMGYGRFFANIRNLISPFNITNEILQEQMSKLRKPS